MRPGVNVGMGKDFTLFAVVAGNANFRVKGQKQNKYAYVVARQPVAA